jgi:hypothetical protein
VSDGSNMLKTLCQFSADFSADFQAKVLIVDVAAA